jgi:hypothetical protein
MELQQALGIRKQVFILNLETTLTLSGNGKPYFAFGNTKASNVQSFISASFVPTASAITQLDF